MFNYICATMQFITECPKCIRNNSPLYAEDGIEISVYILLIVCIMIIGNSGIILNAKNKYHIPITMLKFLSLNKFLQE